MLAGKAELSAFIELRCAGFGRRLARLPQPTATTLGEVIGRDGEFEYHIRHSSELHERIARENRGFERRGGVACAKCGGRGNKIDARPNWKGSAVMRGRHCGPPITLGKLRREKGDSK